MDCEVTFDPLVNVNIRVKTIELTMRRKNAPLVKGRLFPKWVNNNDYVRLYVDRNKLWSLAQSHKDKAKINQCLVTRICVVCSKEKSTKISRTSGGGLWTSRYFSIYQDSVDSKKHYAYLFCGEPCKNMFDLNPLPYEVH